MTTPKTPLPDEKTLIDAFAQIAAKATEDAVQRVVQDKTIRAKAWLGLYRIVILGALSMIAGYGVRGWEILSSIAHTPAQIKEERVISDNLYITKQAHASDIATVALAASQAKAAAENTKTLVQDARDELLRGQQTMNLTVTRLDERVSGIQNTLVQHNVQHKPTQQ